MKKNKDYADLFFELFEEDARELDDKEFYFQDGKEWFVVSKKGKSLRVISLSSEVACMAYFLANEEMEMLLGDIEDIKRVRDEY